MKISYKEIYFPPICEKILNAKLHFIENPKFEKKVKGTKNISLTYEQVLVLQKNIIIDYINEGNLVLEDLINGKKVSETLNELSKIDNVPKRYLPRVKDIKWNERVNSLQKLIGINYRKRPAFEKTPKEFYENYELLNQNNSIVNNLSKKGIFNVVNPITCSAYMSCWNIGIGFMADCILKSYPLMSAIGSIVGATFGFGLGMITQELVREKLPFDEASYLDWKFEEVEIKKSDLGVHNNLIKINEDLPGYSTSDLRKLSLLQNRKIS
jgi:hypothetical protein